MRPGGPLTSGGWTGHDRAGGPVTTGPFDTGHPVWVALHTQAAMPLGPFFFAFVYPVPPWTGVMLLGFGTAGVFQQAAPQRNARLMAWGLGAAVAFIALRLIGLYGEPNPWITQGDGVRTVIDILNVTKYPPSLDFLAVMLGMDLVLLGLFTRPMPGWLAGPLQVFGQVPLFFYLLHLYVFGVLSWLFRSGTSFAVMYLIWLAALAVMYPACRWYARFKARRPIASIWRLL